MMLDFLDLSFFLRKRTDETEEDSKMKIDTTTNVIFNDLFGKSSEQTLLSICWLHEVVLSIMQQRWESVISKCPSIKPPKASGTTFVILFPARDKIVRFLVPNKVPFENFVNKLWDKFKVLRLLKFRKAFNFISSIEFLDSWIFFTFAPCLKQPNCTVRNKQNSTLNATILGGNRSWSQDNGKCKLVKE